MKMTTEEAFVKVLQMHGIEHAFGIIGSAMMPISDLFPQAGIAFWDAAHECNAGMMADGFTRSTGKMSMMVAQNGPGITNFVTPVKTAYWNHTPLLLVTPQAANKTIGQGGFQEVEQMALFKDMVAYQEEVRDPARIAETLNRVILQAKRASAPAQINVPRDFWTQVIDIELPAIVEFERPTGGEDAIEAAAKMLSEAEFPVMLNGAGVVIVEVFVWEEGRGRPHLALGSAQVQRPGFVGCFRRSGAIFYLPLPHLPGVLISRELLVPSVHPLLLSQAPLQELLGQAQMRLLGYFSTAIRSRMYWLHADPSLSRLVVISPASLLLIIFFAI